MVEARLPAMLTVVREINRPRYPAVPMRIEAADSPVTMWNNEVLRLDPATVGLKGPPTWVSRIFPPERAKGQIIGDGEADPAGTARLMVETLQNNDLLPF